MPRPRRERRLGARALWWLDADPNVLYKIFNEPEQLAWSADVKQQRVDQAALNPVSGMNLMYAEHFYACDHGEHPPGVARTGYAAGLTPFVIEGGSTTAYSGVHDHNVCDAEARVWHYAMNDGSARFVIERLLE